MSLYNALADQHRQNNQGWNYPNSCSLSNSVFTNSTSAKEAPSPAVQHHTLSSLLSSPPSADSYVQPQTPQKEEDGMLVGDSGLVVGPEEVMLNHSPVAAPGYRASSGHSQHHMSSDMHSYVHKPSHGQYMQGSPLPTAMQEYSPQRGLSTQSQSGVPPFMQSNHISVSHQQAQRMPQTYSQQPNLQQSQGQQGVVCQQAASLPQRSLLVGQQQPGRQLQGVVQQPLAQQNPSHDQQTSRQLQLGQSYGHQQMPGNHQYSTHGHQFNTSQQPLEHSQVHNQQANVNHPQHNQTHMQQHVNQQQHVSQQHVNQQHVSQQHVNQQHVSQQHVSQQHVNQQHVSQHVNQQHVNQHMHSQPQVGSQQQALVQQANVQTSHLSKEPANQEHLSLADILIDSATSSQNSPGTPHSMHYGSGNSNIQSQQPQQNRKTLLIHRLPQNVISIQSPQPMPTQYSQNQGSVQSQSAMQSNGYPFAQYVGRIQRPLQTQPAQQSLPSELSMMTHTLQHQQSVNSPHSLLNNSPHMGVVKQQPYDPNSRYGGQMHGQRLGMDQHQQQQQACLQQQQASLQQQQLQQACSQQQQSCSQTQQQVNAHPQQMGGQQVPPQQQDSVKEQEMLLVVHPNSGAGANRYISPHHPSQQLSVQQSPQNMINVTMGSPMALSNSPQASSQVAFTSSPQMNLPCSPQMSLQSSPQVSVPNSPQQFTIQGSPSLIQNSPQILMIKNAHIVPKQSVSLQRPQFVTCAPGPRMPNASVLHIQNHNAPQVLHIQNMSQPMQSLLSLPPTSLAGNVMPHRPFQVTLQSEGPHTGGNQQTVQNADPTVSSTMPGCGRGRGQSRGKSGRGRGGRGRAKADSSTGLHMAPNHFRPEPKFPPMLEPCMEAPVPSLVDSGPLCKQEPGLPELGLLTPKCEPDASPILHNQLLYPGSCSPSYASSSAPRLSATNEVWPTPMPCQQSSDGPALSPTSYLDDIKPSPPDPCHTAVPPTLTQTPVAEVCSPPTPTPVQPPPPPQPIITSTPTPAQPVPSPEQKPEVTPPAPPPPPLPAPPAAPKRVLAEDEEGTAVCKYCGYCSSNFEVCEGCKRKLPPDVKVVIKKRKVENAESGDERERTCGGGKVNSTPTSGGPPNRRTLYGNKLQTQSAAFATTGSNMSDMRGKSVGRGCRRGRGSGTPRGGYRPKKMKEPVTLTISSDEDEDPSDARLSTSSMSTNSMVQDDEDGFFPAPVTKPNAFGTSRRNKMQDALGQCVMPTTPGSPNTDVYFNVRGVRIGGMRTTGLEVRFREHSITFKVLSDRTQTELDLCLFLTELTCIKFSFNQSQPVMFLKVTPESGQRLRCVLNMTPNSPEWFDPSSQDTQKNMIVVIVDSMSNENGLRQRLQYYSKQHNLPDFLQEINYDSANDLLVKSTPPVFLITESTLRGFQKFTPSQPLNAAPLSDKGDHASGGEVTNDMDGLSSMAGDSSNDASEGVNNMDNRSSRTPSPRIGFVGPVEKLLAYPPPPAKGAIAITNEDLFCLNEGEFLNDVILDFYLKYLFREKLSEEDRQRTHIFSSFFFKRLTQRSRSSQEQDEAPMTLVQKRHSRVKTWTRHVDIFSKDFLLIPINERSHWFLAVVCFPGLMGQEQVTYQPTPSPCDADIGQSGDSVPTPPQQPKGDHVLGKVISGDSIKKGKSSHTVGFKQSCILIMDSLMGPSRTTIIKILKEYLQVEWDLKKGTDRNMMKTVRGGCPKVPQQTNFSDCGVFVLQYAEAFFQNPIASFSIPMRLENWFPLSTVEKKRDEIRSLILRLQAETSR